MTVSCGFDPHGGDDDRDAVPRFRVLVVCSGNLCRSPLVAALLREGLPPGSAVEVTSAGTRAMVGSPTPRRLVRLAARRGLDLDGPAPRQLVREHLERTDLVLTATRDQRAAVVAALPGALRRTFTVRELARLLRAVPGPRSGRGAPASLRAATGRGGAPVLATPAPLLTLVGSQEGGPGRGTASRAARHAIAAQEVARWSALVPGAAAGRGAGSAWGPGDDLVDPYRRAGRTYRACLTRAEDAAGTILDAVTG